MVGADWEQVRDELDVMERDLRPFGTGDGESASQKSSDDDDPDGSGADETDDTPLEGLEDGETATVSIRIDEPSTDTPDAIATEATAVDETAKLRLVVWESSDCNVDLKDGDCYRLVDVGVSEYQGDLELHVQEYTEFEPIRQGVGHTKPVGDNATLDGEHMTSEEAATDGGGPRTEGDNVPADAEGMLADARRLVDILNRSGEPLSESKLLAKATMNSDVKVL